MSKVSFGPHVTRSGYKFTVTEGKTGVYEIKFIDPIYQQDNLVWYDGVDAKTDKDARFTFWQMEALIHLHQLLATS